MPLVSSQAFSLPAVNVCLLPTHVKRRETLLPRPARPTYQWVHRFCFRQFGVQKCFLPMRQRTALGASSALAGRPAFVAANVCQATCPLEVSCVFSPCGLPVQRMHSTFKSQTPQRTFNAVLLSAAALQFHARSML